VKIIKNKTKIYNQSKKEISILEYISKENKDSSACVIEILSNFQFREHMVKYYFIIKCIVFELLEISLYDLLKSNNFNGLTLDSLKKISYQILETLEFLRQHRLIHCDLKPENILLKYKDRTAVKIIDFGSSCFEDKKIYNYIQSRYYRAPEVILGCDYGIEIDLWSFGCIVVELYSGKIV
jgi:dual specificity tyrosine-phosphorylation-regulated kinase 2/3/4